MEAVPDKKKPRRAAKGKRAHIRRMKQEARRASIPGSEVKKKAPPA